MTLYISGLQELSRNWTTHLRGSLTPERKKRTRSRYSTERRTDLDAVHQRIVRAVEELRAELAQEEPDAERGASRRAIVARHRAVAARLLARALRVVERDLVGAGQRAVVDEAVRADRLHVGDEERSAEPRVSATWRNLNGRRNRNR